MIFSLFGKGSDKDLPKEHGPLKVAIGGAIEIDTLGLHASLAAGKPSMEPPQSGAFIVAAYGEAKLEADMALHRYYDDDDRLLQIMAPPGTGTDGIVDVSLYQPWDSVTPMNKAEWDRWVGPDALVGQPQYDADGIMFARYWGDGPGSVDLVEFTEDIDDGKARRSIHQRCMLYARPVGSVDEMLLINIEHDLGDDKTKQGGSVEFMLGYGLGIADLARV